MERLFTERQWRAIADVEHLTLIRPEYDGFHWWCKRKAILGGCFAGGEFYVGWSGPTDDEDWKVYEHKSGLDFSWASTKELALSIARERILSIDWYLPTLLSKWAQENAETVREWDEKRARDEAREALRVARESARLSKPIPRRRQEIFDKANGKCHYCQTQLELRGRWHIEHKLPRALGGDNSPDNLVAACAPCNHRKKDKTDVEFFALLAAERDSNPAIAARA